MGKVAVIPELLPLYVSGPDAIHAAHALCGGPEALLRRAAEAVEGAGTRYGPGHSEDPAEQEIRALSAFAQQTDLMLDAVAIQKLIATDPFFPGLEHEVGVLRKCGRVLKDYDTWLINEETGEMAYKPTDSLFDYLTDHLLANHFFGDDIRLEGFYLYGSDLHLVLSQPFILGSSLESEIEFIDRLEQQGLWQRVPGSSPSDFFIDGGDAGQLLITDMTQDNALYSEETGLVHPIDIHFKFPGRSSRLAALEILNVYRSIQSGREG